MCIPTFFARSPALPVAALALALLASPLAAQEPERPERERCTCVRVMPLERLQLNREELLERLDLERGEVLERLQLDREAMTELRARMLEEVGQIELRQPEVRALVRSVAMPGRFGLEITDLNEELGGYFGRSSGALVLRSRDEAALPLRGGDVIVAIGDREVEGAQRARQLLSTYRSGEEVVVTVWRDGAEVRVEGVAP